MDYIRGNKAAWEEAFDHRKDNWGDTVVDDIRKQAGFYLHPVIKEVLDTLSLEEKHVAQFCCSNGRELLSIAQEYHMQGTGFDIAENMIAQGNQYAKELQLPCDFIACNLLEMDKKYENSFDLILFTIGAITWFENLSDLFLMVSSCLKPGGILLLHDYHPFMNLLPLPGDETFQKGTVTLLEHTYFMKEPWIENNGMSYISGTEPSQTFTSFSHSIAEILNSTIQSGMVITAFQEYDYDIGLSDVYDHKGLPLSILMTAVKK